MEPPEFARAVAATRSIAASLALPADDAIVLSNSNKLILRLMPADTVARVAPPAEQVLRFEIDVVRRLTDLGSPVAAPDPRVEPRVYEEDGFVVTWWTGYEPEAVSPADHAGALVALHEGMRRVDVPAPRFTDRVDEAEQIVASRDLSPAMADADREFLAGALRHLRHLVTARGAVEQLLHGEPHPGNLLGTVVGPRFIDFETCCRGPVEFDLAHAPDEVAPHYPGVDADLLRTCRILKLAMITAWRWDRGDQFPNGRRLGIEGLADLREALNGSPA